MLQRAHGGANILRVSCDAFVYLDASNPKRCLAPDGALAARSRAVAKARALG